MALASRALLGCGDAMTFISVLRLGSRWFPARRGPLVAQLAGAGRHGGQPGLHARARPAPARRRLDRRPSRAARSAASSSSSCCCSSSRTTPRATSRAPVAGTPAAAFVRRQIAASWREPGTRLGHVGALHHPVPRRWCSCCCGACRSWSRRRGCPAATAGELLTLVVLSNMVVGLVYGQIIARHHAARTAAGARHGRRRPPLLWAVDAGLARRPRADVAAGRAVRGARRLRARRR